MTVVYRSPFIPSEWIAAHGLEPFRLVPDGRSVPAGPVPDTAGVCPFLRAFVNEACHSRRATTLVLTTFCDQVRRAFAIVQSEHDIPVHLFNLPATWQNPSVHKLYGAELERLSRFMVRHGGRRPTDAALRDILLASESRRQGPGRQAQAINWLRPDITQPVVPGNVRHKDGVPTTEGPRPGHVPVALLGGPLQQKDGVLFEWIQAAGAFVALDGTETGERTLPAPFNHRRVQEDPFDELCNAYFGQIPDAFRRPNSELYRWIGREMRCREIRGVLIVRYVWCDTWHAEVHRLREWLPVPCIDVDLTADRPGARTRTRVEAFVEALRRVS